MNISYRREMKRNYLIIEPEDIFWQGYEFQMLLENSIDGLLCFSMMQTDDQVRFYYEITSRQPLSRLLEGKMLSEEEIKTLIFGITAVLSQLERYLLNERSIFLKPDYIYVEPDSFKVWLCLIPGLDRDFIGDYGKLLEYLLGHVDHQNKECVVLTYGLYQESRKENYGLDDIMKLVQNGWRTDAGQAIADLPQPQIMLNPGKADYEKNTEPGGGVKHNWFEKTKGMLSHRKKPPERKYSSKITEQSDTVPWQQTFLKTTEPVAEEFIPDGHDTMLLSEPDHRTVSQNAWLHSLDGEAEDIQLAYVPFVIGKQKNLVDYVLDRESVSRLHVKIDKVGEQYLITDLNSTNGTRLNDLLLENNASASLNAGDTIQIAICKYQFYT